MLNHTFTINDELTLLVGIDRSTSLDDDKWQWEPGSDSYTPGKSPVILARMVSIFLWAFTELI